MSVDPENRRLPRFWAWLTLSLFNLAMFVALLYGLELCLDLTAPPPLPHPSEVRNRYGFREREFAVPKPPGACRIMVLGDSFTWGRYVSLEERYTSLLEVSLDQAYPDKQIEVLNFGVPGGPTTLERDSLRDYRALVEPDLIVVGFVLNDPQPHRQNYSVERARFEQRFGAPPFNVFLDRVEKLRLERTAELIRRAIDGFIVKVGLVPAWQVALQRVYEKDSTEWLEFEKALRDIKAMSDEMNLPPPLFAILNQGVYTDRPTDYNHPDEELQLYLRWYHQAEETAARLGFHSINYEREFAEQLAREPVAVHVLDGHPSAKVHRIYAEKLFREIKAVYVDSGRICRAGS